MAILVMPLIIIFLCLIVFLTKFRPETPTMYGSILRGVPGAGPWLFWNQRSNKLRGG